MLELNKIYNMDCLEGMNDIPDNSIDAIVTDPPYELGFMGRKWDSTGIAYNVEVWKEALRVLKHGGHLLAFGGTRTYHRMVCAIEDAGFEIRDQMQWIYGSGFPKSMDISKAIDKKFGEEREVIGKREHPTLKDKSKIDRQECTQYHASNPIKDEWDITAPATPEAKQWEGWGTALKPANEPIVVARKPLSEKTVAENVLKWGTGGINIDDCRIPLQEYGEDKRLGGSGIWKTDKMAKNTYEGGYKGKCVTSSELGRFPANVIHDGSEEVLELFPQCGSGNGKSPYCYAGKTYDNKDTSMFNGDKPSGFSNYNDSGSAARFFYCAKASKKEKNQGLEELEEKQTVGGGGGIGDYLKDVNSASGKFGSEKAPSKNIHPTVKPISLMKYLVTLITQPNGIVLDPFSGSGTTLIACKELGFNYIGFELEKEYCEISEKRLAINE